MSDEPRALSVSEAMQLAKRALEALTLRVVGEVSEVTDRPGYKAVYFTLSDGSAVMPCLTWRDAYEASGVVLRAGMMVEVTGGMTVYAAKGRLQFQVRTIAAAGEGLLRMQVAALARRLDAEGLMAAGRKRALPTYPERIGLVTSPRGKAIHDVIRTLRRRYPVAELVIAGVTVEGAEAVREIVRGLQAVAEAGVDVAILARGGGSYEDLMPFNDEAVARAVAAMSMSIVTGIGHEPDTTIADMVSDLRASTPTAAAESVAPSADEVFARLRSSGALLARGLRHTEQRAAQRLAALGSRPVLADPYSVLVAPAQRLDIAADALSRTLPTQTQRAGEQLDALGHALGRGMRDTVARGGERITLLTSRLEDLSPLGILGRGYAVCYDGSGRRIVRSAGELTCGDGIRVGFLDGVAGCTVDSLETEEANVR